MQRITWTVAVCLAFGITLPASAEIIKGSLVVRGAEMS